MSNSQLVMADSWEQQVVVARRFYVALVLKDFIGEVPLGVVARKFKIPRGSLQALQTTASAFAGMVVQFCHHLKWQELEDLFGMIA